MMIWIATYTQKAIKITTNNSGDRSKIATRMIAIKAKPADAPLQKGCNL
jgi:hypothetical protein